MPPSPLHGRRGQPQFRHSGRKPKIVLTIIEGKAGFYRDLKGSLEFRMRRSAVVAFARILHDQFPIGLLEQSALERYLGVRQFIWSKKRCDGIPEWIEVRRVASERDIDTARQQLELNRLQTVIAWFKVGRHPGGADQPSIEVVSPFVIRAYEPFDLTLTVGANLRPPMATCIMKSAHRAVTAASDHNGVLAD